MKAVLVPAIAVCIVLGAQAATAEPKVTQKIKTYTVSATSMSGLVKEMNQRGPKGYWGYTEWFVRWTGDCKLTVSIDITLPRHGKPAAMPAEIRTKFDSMVAALTAHEKQHGQHAVLAAREIEKAKCSGGDAIIRKYNDVDVKFDKKTDHGKKAGVVLK